MPSVGRMGDCAAVLISIQSTAAATIAVELEVIDTRLERGKSP